MPSVLLVARAECRLLVRDPGYRWLLAGFAALLVLAAALGGWRHARERTTRDAFQGLVRAQWEGQPDRHPHRVAHYGTFAFKPVGPLAAFEPGVESHAGRLQYLEAHRQNAANFAESGALSSAFRFGELSPAFVLQLVLPLLIVALGHRGIAGDVATGRDRWVLAQGLAPAAWRAGKALGLAVALAPFGLLAVLAAGAAALTAPAAPAADTALRLGALLAAHGGLAAAWLAVTVALSGAARRPERALAWAAAVWLLTAVVLPRGVAVWAEVRHPLPTKSEFASRLAADLAELGDAHDPHDPHFARFRAELLARHGVDRVEDLPFNYGAAVMAHGEELGAQVFARRFGEVAALVRAQDALLRRAAWGSPSLATRVLATAAAGTDVAGQLDFERAAEAYRYTFVQRLNELHRTEVKFAGDRDQRIAAAHWAAFPDFALPARPAAAALGDVAGAWGALAAWIIGPVLALLLVGRKGAAA